MAQQDNITFEKGMIPQIDRLSKVPGSYLEAINMMRDDSGNIRTDIGTSSIKELPSGYKVVGVKHIGNEIIIASTNDTNSVIGVLDISNNYTEVVNNTVLGFKKVNRVNLEAKINYKGDRLLYIAGKGIKLRYLNLDNIPTTDFDKSTSLFLEYALPRTELITVSSGGEVLSGVYQFATRLVTDNNNVTSFGPVSGIIPIGVGSPSGNRKDYDGGPTQTLTSNQITLTIDNIDTSFAYIETCVITYIGEANTVKINSLGKVPINSKTELQIVYSGSKSELEEILEPELEIDTTSYESGEFIVQKDNSLLIAGLGEAEDTINWQDVANDITIKYITHEVNSNETIDVQRQDGTSFKSLSDDDKMNWAGGNGGGAGEFTWTDVGVAGDFEDYKNPVTCSKFTGYKRGEVYSFSFTPIYTTGRKGDAFHIPAKTPIEGTTMLEYVTVEGVPYPEGFGTLTNTPVRYHKMPSNSKVPFSYVVSGKEKINILGVEVILPEGEWRNNIYGYIIGRENRTGKETIISQGLIKALYKTGNPTSNTYSIVPSTGRMKLIDMDKAGRDEEYNSTMFTFHSPDLITEPIDFIPSKLRLVSKMTSTFEYANTYHNRYTRRHYCKNLVSCKHTSSANTEVGLTGLKTELKTESIDPINDDPRSPDGELNISVAALGKISILGRRLLQSTVLESSGSYPRTETTNVEVFDDWAEDPTFGSTKDGCTYTLSSLSFTTDLYEIERANTSYYGNIYNKEYMPIITVLFSKDLKDPRTNAIINNLKPICFGGDTFISRYAYTFRDTPPFFGTVGSLQDVPRTDSTFYFMLESKNNYNYRHYIVADSEEVGSTPYYPKYKILQSNVTTSIGINDFPVSYEHPNLYNKQYSAQNNFQKRYSKTIGDEDITAFGNRIAYSSTSIEGEKFDAFRLFLGANYHDIPKQYGSITGMFVQGNDLYIHTQRSLWRSFYNTLATQATSEGDIVLGNGGAFPRPSMPIVTVDGGYAGCLGIEASVGTPMGRYFYDANNSKLYYLSDGLKEVSNPAIFDLCREKWNNISVVLGYDTENKRVVMSGNNLGISYKPELSSFDSLHTYSFDYMLSRNLNNYIIKDNLIHKLDDTVVTSYFGVKDKSSIKVVSVIHPSISKRFTSAEMVVTSTNPVSGLNLPNNFFSNLKAYSLERHTGYNTLRFIQDYTEDLETLGNIFVYKANNKFRFAFPPDVVFDITKDIHDVTNHVTSSYFTDEDRVFLPDIVDNHLVVELYTDNESNRMLKVNSFIINFDQNIT